MKKIYIFLFCICSLLAFSQAPTLINYQGIVRNASGLPFTSAVKIKFEIFPVASGGSAIFSETQSTATNSLGLFSTQIGKTAALNVNWSTGSWFLEVSIDTTNSGSSFSIAGRQQMISVPFALYAENAGSAPPPSLTFSNNVLYVGTNSVSIPSAPVYSAGNGIAINSGSVINTAPDQTVNIAQAGNAQVTGTYPNYTVNALPQVLSINSNVITLSNGGGNIVLPATSATPNTTVTGTGIANVTSSGTNSFNVSVTPPNITGSGATSVSGSYPNFIISSSPAITPTINGAGIATVTPLSGNNFTVNVAQPVLLGSGATTVSGTYPNFTISSPTIAAAVTPTITGTGVVSVTPSGNNFTVNVPSPSLSFGGGVLTLIQGTATSAVSIPPPVTPTINGAGIATVTPLSGNNFTVNVAPLNLTGTGSATVTGTYPNININTPISGPPPPAWLLLGNGGTIDGTHFLGTSDNVPLNFRVNNQKSGRIDPLLSNTFLGYWAGRDNTTGSQNSAFGINALLANTTGNGNSAFGTAALTSNNGSNNSAFGKSALSANTTGNDNTASGHQALSANTTGSINAAFGANALLNNTTGYFNTAIGADALRNHTNGFSNTAEGYQAMYWNNGTYNTGTGYGVLQNNTTGSQNTAFGAVAGYNSTGTGNVFLGYAAGYNASGNNQLHIANSSSGLPLIFGDFSTGRVGLGTTSPSTGRLEISHTATSSALASALYSDLTGTGAGNYIGIYSRTDGSSTGQAIGIKGFAVGSGTGNKTAVDATAVGTAAGVTNTGLNAYANGPGTNYGIFSDASGGSVNWAGYFNSGNVFIQNKLGIGTNNPLNPLHVNGAVTITDGSQGAGKVLTSDAVGNASWKPVNLVTTNGFTGKSIASVSNSPTLLQSALCSFSKTAPDTRIEVIVQTHLFVADMVSTNSILYEVRLNGISALSNTGRSNYFIDNNNAGGSPNFMPATFIAEFSTLAPGVYNVEIWVSAINAGGTGSSITVDNGNYSASSVIIKEYR